MRRHLPTLTSAEGFAAYFRINQWHMAGWCVCEGALGQTSDEDFEHWREYTGQGERATRQDLSHALAEAEAEIERWIKFPVAPRWFTDFTVRLEQGGYWRKDFNYRSISLPIQYVGRFGVRTLTKVNDLTITPDITVPVTKEFQRVNVAGTVPSGTLASQIRLYHKSRMGEEKEFWEIRDFSATISGTTLTLSIAQSALLLPEKTLEDDCHDRDTLDNYQTEIEVWVDGVDSTDMGYSKGYDAKTCQPPLLEDKTQTALLLPKNPALGIVQVIPASHDGVKWIQNTCPDMYPMEHHLNFEAGYPLQSGQIHPLLAAGVYLLAAARLSCDIPTCDCKGCNQHKVNSYRHPYRIKTGEGEQGIEGDTWKVAYAPDLSAYPFGFLAGEVDSWNKIKRMKQTL